MEKVLFADVFTKNFKKILHVPSVVIDDPIFRLHYKVTGLTLLFLSIIVTGYQFIGEPIKCIQKDDIPENLLNTYCWIEGTFSLPKALIKKVGVEVVYPGVDKYEKNDAVIEHAYYQWVCFVLFLQAVVFCVPYVIWRALEGGKLKSLVQEFRNPIVCGEDDGKEIEEEDGEDDKKDDKKDDKDEDKKGDQDKDKKDGATKPKKKKDKKKEYYKALAKYYIDHTSENALWYAMVFLVCEFLNFVNVLGQIFFLDRFLGGYFTGYGTDVVRYVNTDQENRFDPMIRLFPRLTKCTFHRYGSSGDVQKHDALCLLPLNILNEKIFVIMWFWLLILAILGGLVIIYRIALIYNSDLRFKLLYHVSSLNPESAVARFKQWSYANWFQIYMLADNIDNIHFRCFVEEYDKSSRCGENEPLLGSDKNAEENQAETGPLQTTVSAKSD